MSLQAAERTAVQADLHDWDTNALRRRRAWLAVLVASASGFLFVIDAAFVSLSTPRIEAEFPNASRSVIEWVATGFMVMQAAMLLVAGRLGDRYGRKRAFLFGLALFSIGEVCTAVAPNLGLIIAARAFTGFGGAFLTAGTLAIVLPMFPASKSGTAIGTWGGIGSVAAWGTPLLGPYLVNHGWRWAYVAIAPIAMVMFVLAWRILPEQYGEQQRDRTDRISLAVGPPALGLLMLVLSSGRNWGWLSPATIGGSVLVIVLLVVLVHRSLHAEHPLLDLGLLRTRGYSGSLLAGVLNQAGFYGFWLTAPLIMHNVWNWSVVRSGVAMALCQILASVGSPIAGRLVERYGYRDLIMLGGVFVGAGMSWIILATDEQPHFWFGFLPGALLFGLGCAFAGTLSAGASLAHLRADQVGIGNSLQQLIRRMGGALGVALAYVLLGDAKGSELLSGAERVWWMVVVVHLLVAVPMYVLTPRRTGART